MHPIRFPLGLRPYPAGGAYSALPDPLAVFKGPTFKATEGWREEKEGGREGEGKGMEGEPTFPCRKFLATPLRVLNIKHYFKDHIRPAKVESCLQLLMGNPSQNTLLEVYKLPEV